MKYASKLTSALLLATCMISLQNCGKSEAKKEEEKASKEPAKEVVTEGFVLKKGTLSSSLQVPEN